MRKTILILLILLTSCQTPNSLLTDKYEDYLYALFEFQVEYNDKIKTDYIESDCNNERLRFLRYSRIKILSNFRDIAVRKKRVLKKINDTKDGKIYSIDYFFGSYFSSNIWGENFSVSYKKGKELFSVEVINDEDRIGAEKWETLKLKLEGGTINKSIETNDDDISYGEGVLLGSILTIKKGEIIDFEFFIW